jgi:hypothetical protein
MITYVLGSPALSILSPHPDDWRLSRPRELLEIEGFFKENALEGPYPRYGDVVKPRGEFSFAEVQNGLAYSDPLGFVNRNRECQRQWELGTRARDIP